VPVPQRISCANRLPKGATLSEPEQCRPAPPHMAVGRTRERCSNHQQDVLPGSDRLVRGYLFHQPQAWYNIQVPV
jgi:hypothetical protein